MSKKELHTIQKKKEKNYTIATKFDQHYNKVSMFEIVKEVDEETVTKENNFFLTRETTDSLLPGNVEYSDKINISLMIEGDVTKKNHWTIEK